MRPQKTISLSMKHHSRSRRVLSVFQCIYTCSSMRSTAVWLQSNHLKHPLKSGVNAGPRVEHFTFTHTHRHDAARASDSWVERRCSFIVSFKTTDTHMQYIQPYLSLPSKVTSTGRKRTKQREKKMKDEGHWSADSVLLEPLKALGSPSRMKLPALIWFYLLCYFNNSEHNLCFILAYTFRGTMAALDIFKQLLSILESNKFLKC